MAVEQRQQPWSVLAASVGNVIPAAVGTYWWRSRSRGSMDSCKQSQPPTAPQRQQQQQTDEAATPADADDGIGCGGSWQGPASCRAFSEWGCISLPHPLEACSSSPGLASEALAAAVAKALLGSERLSTSGGGGKAAENGKRPGSPPASPRGVLSVSCPSRRSDSLVSSVADSTPYSRRSGSLFSTFREDAAPLPAAAARPISSMAPSVLVRATRSLEDWPPQGCGHAMPAAAVAEVGSAAGSAAAAARLPAAMLPAAIRASRSFGSSGAEWDDAQALVDYMARDEFWSDVQAGGDASQSDCLRRTSQVALRGASWMADGAGGAATPDSTLAFLRALPESSRRCIVNRAHAVLGAVLGRTALLGADGVPLASAAEGEAGEAAAEERQQPLALVHDASRGSTAGGRSNNDLYGQFAEPNAATGPEAPSAAPPADAGMATTDVSPVWEAAAAARATTPRFTQDAAPAAASASALQPEWHRRHSVDVGSAELARRQREPRQPPSASAGLPPVLPSPHALALRGWAMSPFGVPGSFGDPGPFRALPTVREGEGAENPSGGEGSAMHKRDAASAAAAATAEAAASTARVSWEGTLAAFPLHSMQLRFEDVRICRRADGSLWKLGSGGYGQVYKALKNEVIPVAVKVLDSNGDRAEFAREASILESCRDRNIVQFLGYVSDGVGQTMIVTEFMERGDLFSALQRDVGGSGLLWYRRGSASPGLGRHIALDLARAIHFLHSSRIVHLDVKSANVLLGRNFVAKLGDVGMARIQRQAGGGLGQAPSAVGTLAWSAPEMLLGERCTEKVDMYSFGVVLWELVTGEQPARGRLRPPRVPKECPQDVADLLAACLSLIPSQRPSAKAAVEALVAAADGGPATAAGRLGARSRRSQSLPLSEAVLAGLRSVKCNSAEALPEEAHLASPPPAACELLRAVLQLAHATYGGPGAAARAGWQAPSAATVTTTTDPRLHSDFVMALGACLARPDALERGSRAAQRLAMLHAAWLGVVAARAAANPEYPHWVRQHRLDHYASLSNASPASPLASSPGGSHGNGSHDGGSCGGGGGGSLCNSSANDSAASIGLEPPAAAEAVQRCVKALQLTTGQAQRIAGERSASLQRQAATSRDAQLPEQPQQRAHSDGGARSGGGLWADASAAQAASAQADEGPSETSAFVGAFYAALTPAQVARLVVAAFPCHPDPAACADFMAGRSS